LYTILISKADALQARGRTGRTRSGFYIPVSISDYDKLQPHSKPAILLEPLERIILQVLSMYLTMSKMQFIDQPSKENIESGVNRLQLLGALDKSKRITKLRKNMVKLPVDPAQAKIILTAHDLKVLPEAIILIAIF
jgi:HrpA-like RNA helicase